MAMPVTQRKIKPGEALGGKRCCRIVTDDTTRSRFDFSRAAKAVGLSAIPGASIYDVMT